jgi:membrane protein YdbS with pleckstrin-like domain
MGDYTKKIKNEIRTVRWIIAFLLIALVVSSFTYYYKPEQWILFCIGAITFLIATFAYLKRDSSKRYSEAIREERWYQDRIQKQRRIYY